MFPSLPNGRNMMSVFKAYDVRGVYGNGLDENLAYKVGNYLPQLLNSDHVMIGRDARTSSPSLFDAMCKGVTDRGCDVWDIGLCTTPTIYFAAPKLNAKASVMITASHNPPEYNGFKISKEFAKPVGKETGLPELEELCKGEAVVSSTKGKIIPMDVREDYLNFTKQWMKPLKGLKIVFDSSNGMEGLNLRDTFQNSGAECTYLNLDVDCTFPNHEANPLVIENVHQLMNKVTELGADVGVMFDGDSDRAVFVDEKGQYVFPDLIIGLMARDLMKQRKGTVIYDIRSSRSVIEEIERLGGTPRICKVGHSYAKALLRETDGIFGGELAGHYYFNENNYCDSAIIATLVVLGVLAESKQTLSEIIDDISKYEYSGEINFKAENKDELIDIIQASFPGGNCSDLDGIRVDFEDWWFNVRKSNTEPYLRLVCEAKNKALLDEKVASIRHIIEQNRI